MSGRTDDDAPQWLRDCSSLTSRKLAIEGRFAKLGRLEQEAYNELSALRMDGAKVILEFGIKMHARALLAYWKVARAPPQRTYPAQPSTAAAGASSFVYDDGITDAELAAIPMPSGASLVVVGTPSTPRRPPVTTPPPVPTQVARTATPMPHPPQPLVFDRAEMRRKALGALHARALANVEEHAGVIEEMPDFPNYKIATYLCAKHLPYGERFKVLTFLTMNRVPPVLVAELFVAAGMLQDQAAADHCLSLLHKMHKGEFTAYRAYCQESKAWEDVSPPAAGASDWTYASADWQSAITAVQRLRQGIAGKRKAP